MISNRLVAAGWMPKCVCVGVGVCVCLCVGVCVCVFLWVYVCACFVFEGKQGNIGSTAQKDTMLTACDDWCCKTYIPVWGGPKPVLSDGGRKAPHRNIFERVRFKFCKKEHHPFFCIPTFSHPLSLCVSLAVSR